jgi:hypothetical protein
MALMRVPANARDSRETAARIDIRMGRTMRKKSKASRKSGSGAAINRGSFSGALGVPAGPSVIVGHL